LLLIPALLPIVILSVIPLVRGIYLGFTDARAGLNVPTNFIGLDNFRALLDDELFVNSFKIGLIWSVAVTAIGFCFALGLALLLTQDLRGRWLLPVHNGTFDLAMHGWRDPFARASALSAERDISLATPMLGEHFDLAAPQPTNAGSRARA
jgi:hypothetical protein